MSNLSTARRGALAGIVAFGGLLTGCLSVDPPDGTLACTTSAECPSAEWVCLDSRCHRGPGEEDASIDASEPVDASRLDAGVDARVDDGGMGDGAVGCTDDSECDDGNACTTDTCADGECVRAALTCDDSIACTVDGCSAETGCTVTNDDGACAAGRTCDPTGAGADANGCVVAPECDTAAECDDAMFCTDDACVAGSCTHAVHPCAEDSSACTLPPMCDEAGDACVEPFDTTSLTSVVHCGTSATVCVAPCMVTHPTREPACVGGACNERCVAGRVDVDGEGANGCECVRAGAMDPPDDLAEDANCDGADGVIDGPAFVYVTPTGSGNRNGGSPANAAPLLDAIAIASSSARRHLLLATGDYHIPTAIMAPNGLRMFGGYAPSFRSRAGTSRVISSASSALRLQGVVMVEIDSVDWETIHRASTGDYAHTIDVVDSTNILLRRLTVTAGDGAPGAHGAPGGPGSIGAMGTRGNDGIGTSGGAGGGSGPGRGGNGGNYGTTPQNGVVGSIGTMTGIGCGGGGAFGAGGSMSTCQSGFFYDGNAGSPGQPGCAVGPGLQGGPGTGPGTIGLGGVWMPPSAGMGGVGPLGQVGGGGGGGGAFRCTASVAGGGGGSGGRGGTGGIGGAPGAAGGASIAIVALGSSLMLQQVTLRTGEGGRGGTGGDGGMGGAGGPGGMGAFGGAADASGVGNGGGRGGSGGVGGRGGVGGCGGGGVGGPSVGVFERDSTVSQVATGFMIGPGGAGGNACPMGGGNSGGVGVAMGFISM